MVNKFRPQHVVEIRFWNNVLKTDTCWMWQGLIAPNGYGRTWLHGKNHGAHRLAYEWTRGPIPKGMYVLHHCDMPACVNPEHLFLGTAADNYHDAFRKGRIPIGANHWSTRHPERYRRGTTHPFSKFTEEQVREIRAAITAGARPTDVAKQFNVSRRAIYHLMTDAWKHIV
jgi:hypothetical protein